MLTKRHSKPAKGRTWNTPLYYAVTTFFMVITLAFLYLVTFSVPYITEIYYLKLGNHTRYGTLGSCAWYVPTSNKGYACSDPHLGVTGRFIPGRNIITRGLVTTIMAAAFASISSLFTLFFWLTPYKAKLAAANFFLTLWTMLWALVSFILVCIVFVTARSRGRDVYPDSSHDWYPQYGPAMWLHMVAFICSIITTLCALVSWMGERRTPRRDHIDLLDTKLTPQSSYMA